MDLQAAAKDFLFQVKATLCDLPQELKFSHIDFDQREILKFSTIEIRLGESKLRIQLTEPVKS